MVANSFYGREIVERISRSTPESLAAALELPDGTKMSIIPNCDVGEVLEDSRGRGTIDLGRYRRK